MRIVGYIDHPVFKITVFRMDTRISVKFEDRDLEQTYKFRINDQLNSLQEVKNLVAGDFIIGVEEEMNRMRALQQKTLVQQIIQNDDEEFEEII